jgi:uncharacterized protein
VPVKIRKFSRRRFLTAGFLSAPLLAIADAKWVEPGWLKIRRVSLGIKRPGHRIVHFTDLHHKGDRNYLEEVVSKLNALSPDLVCFTGDLIEDKEHLPEVLELLAKIKSPLYGVPGNHDYWSKAPFDPIKKCFEDSGGAWLLDEGKLNADGKINILGASCLSSNQPELPLKAGMKNILLMHYPAWVKRLGTQKFDLILAGHSHGGQVRIPFYGPISLPFGVDEYDLGLFQTASGPLYVNAGLGWFYLPLRFRCRPEITVFDV